MVWENIPRVNGEKKKNVGREYHAEAGMDGIFPTEPSSMTFSNFLFSESTVSVLLDRL